VTNAIPAELAAGATRLTDHLQDIRPEALEPHVIVRLRALDASGDRLEQAELAELLGISRRTVVNRLAEFQERARKLLAET